MVRIPLACRPHITALALFSISLCSCRPPSPPLIAVVPETTAQELWESEHAGAEHAAQTYGFRVYWNGPSREDDITRQIQIVNDIAARHVAGLILSPDHSIALISPVRAALAQGIPTVVVGSRLSIDPGGKLAYIVNDDEAMGRMAAERLTPSLRTGDAVALLGVNPAILSLVQRANAIQSALSNAVPGIQVIERHSTSFGFDEAEQSAETILHEMPNLRAIVALDINQTRATIFALQSSPLRSHIVLIGCDQDLDLVHLVRTGEIDALIAEDTYTMGFDAVETLARERNGDPVTPELFVAPVLVTREQVDRPEIQKVLSMDWRVQ